MYVIRATKLDFHQNTQLGLLYKRLFYSWANENLILSANLLQVNDITSNTLTRVKCIFCHLSVFFFVLQTQSLNVMLTRQGLRPAPGLARGKHMERRPHTSWHYFLLT